MELSNLVNISTKKTLLEFINNNLSPKDIEKKLFGEVFTPLELVEEMLNTLPSEVWVNPTLKWLEPSSGLGNFTICIFYRLMDGLKDEIPDEAIRERYIIENMLYMAELNKANAYICRSIFKETYGYKVNLYEGDFLKLNIEKQWGIKEFDIIVGNPPYNEGGTKHKSKPLWYDFILKAFSILKENKYLLFITPSNWRKPNPDIDLFIYQILYLKMLTQKYVNQIFKVQIILDYYLIQKIKPYKETLIIDNNGKTENIFIKDFIPSGGIKIYYYLNDLSKEFGFLNSINNSIHHSSKLKKNKDSQFKFSNIHSITEKSIDIRYSNKLHPHQQKIKVIFSKGSYIYPIIDNSHGVTEYSNYILVNNLENGELVRDFLTSNLISFIIQMSKWQGYGTYNWVFHLLPDPLKLPNYTSSSDLSIYKYFNLTQQEVLEIETTLGKRARHHSTTEELAQLIKSM